MPRWIRWKFENPWKILGWCLESAQRSFFSISSGRNWYFLSKVMKSAILSHFPSILYRKKPKTTLFDFRTCSPSQKVMKFAWDLSYIIRMKPWKYWDGLISPTIKWHDSQTCASDRYCIYNFTSVHLGCSAKKSIIPYIKKGFRDICKS